MDEQKAARIFVVSNGLQNIGDAITAAKTVLPWILAAGGAPAFVTAMLVPIRESGSMLPQEFLTPWVIRHRSRKRLWVIGSMIQAFAALLIGIAAFLLTGWALGAAVLTGLAVLSLGRSLCSITSKDVQGRTMRKGTRGIVTGRATMLGGLASLVIGIVLLPIGSRTSLLAALIIFSAACWFLAGRVFARIDEPTYPTEGFAHRNSFQLLKSSVAFRRFVIVRSLLLVTALSTSFLVTLAHSANLSGVGVFLLATGAASILGGKFSGRLSDVSSRLTMAWASLFASIVLFVTIAFPVIAPLSFFLVTLAHTAVRVARKTYVVDMAEGDERTQIVGAANTLMGVVLLVVGAISGAISFFGVSAAITFLAVLGVVGFFGALRLEEVSVGRRKA